MGVNILVAQDILLGSNYLARYKEDLITLATGHYTVHCALHWHSKHHPDTVEEEEKTAPISSSIYCSRPPECYILLDSGLLPVLILKDN